MGKRSFHQKATNLHKSKLKIEKRKKNCGKKKLKRKRSPTPGLDRDLAFRYQIPNKLLENWKGGIKNIKHEQPYI